MNETPLSMDLQKFMKKRKSMLTEECTQKLKTVKFILENSDVHSACQILYGL